MLIWNGKIISLPRLTERLAKAGYKVSVSHLSRIFSGQRTATRKFIRALSKALGLSLPQAEEFVEKAVAATQAFRRLERV